MTSYDISGDDVVEVRASPALEAAANVNKLKDEGAALVKAGDWAGAFDQYAKTVAACEAAQSVVSADFEAERAAEKCHLACLANQALCALKLEKYVEAKDAAQAAIEKHSKARVVDDSGFAKCLFRRGQAHLGLGDARAAVDAIAQAVNIEQAQLQKQEATKQQKATLVGMKRKLMEARKAANEESRKSAAELKASMSGFLKNGSKKGLSDPKEERKALVAAKIDAALNFVFSPEPKGEDKDKGATRIAPNYDAMIMQLVAARHEACAAKDQANELALTFAEGFVAFIASAPESGSGSGREKFYVRCADALQSYWQLRDELERTTQDEDMYAPPCKIGDVAGLECCAHALMQLNKRDAARAYFERFVAAADAAGPQAAYHNLPDSFLLQRGMSKMSDPERRVSRWKHRAHSPRALFDARTALCAICADAGDRAAAVVHADKAVAHAADDDERLTAHKNLAYVLKKPMPDGSEIPAADLERAQTCVGICEGLEEKIKMKGKDVDDETNRIRDPAPADTDEEDAMAEGVEGLEAEEVDAADGPAEE
mmetsp:Transcript_24294/g.72899  ORF Transcript_24294/g.72899 Transcript_24294/m.72899 type:complete len:544 (-) Transcript_24294:46-1677(-)